ncbi:MAG: hypothetical protein AB8B56_13925 [Crocinitomicaceae bacterium]
MKKKTLNNTVKAFQGQIMNPAELQTIRGGQGTSIVEDEVQGFIVEDEIGGFIVEDEVQGI